MEQEYVHRAHSEGEIAVPRSLCLANISWFHYGFQHGLETEVAKHLAATYGDRAWAVASMAEASGQKWPLHGVRINPNYPCTCLFPLKFIFLFVHTLSCITQT